jgi:hypothetical protein
MKLWSVKLSEHLYRLNYKSNFSNLNFFKSHTDLITKLVAKAVIRCLPNRAEDFDGEYVRVIKLLGGSI